MIYLFDLIGTAVFAVTGALAAQGRQIDLYGVIVFSLVTAVGGGTARDLLLGRLPVFWIMDTTYIWVGAAAGIGAFLLARRAWLPGQLLVVGDALGLGLFTVIGAEIGLAETGSPLVAVVMGVLTGTGGGIVRDLLAGRIPLVLQREIYATASVAGGLLYVAGRALALPEAFVSTFAGLAVVLIRLLAIWFHQSLPVFRVKDELNS